MDKSGLLFLFRYRVMAATTKQPETHRDSRDWNNGNNLNNGRTVCRSLSSTLRGLSGPRLAARRAHANGLLAGWLLLKQSEQELSDTASTSRSEVT